MAKKQPPKKKNRFNSTQSKIKPITKATKQQVQMEPLPTLQEKHLPNTLLEVKQRPTLRRSQLKKKVSISSENFVMCKVKNFQQDYEIVGKLGEGSFGSVYRVRHRTLQLNRALKKIKKNTGSKFSSFEEIEVLKKLDHINILKIFQFYETEEYYMIVTDIFEGRELFDEIVDSEKIGEDVSSRIIREILVTLNYTHSLGIAHRDIKPENILVRNIADPRKFKIKIVDWGLGTLLKQQYCDRVCGTPQYAAPQVFEGKYSVLCDMWSLGVLTFIMLTGNMPFKGTNTQATISQVKKCTINHRKTGFNNLSDPAKDFINKLMRKQPTQRLSASAALQHPWITQHHNDISEPLFLKQTLQRLKQYNITNHFGVAVVNLINNHYSSNQQREKLEDIFKFLDSNGDGVLSCEELIAGYARIYGKETAQQIAKETFNKLDVNNSGTLEYSEFIAYGLRREKEKEKAKLKEAFDMFDMDKNGTIEFKEIANILECKLSGLYEDEIKKLILEDIVAQGTEKSTPQVINFQQFYELMQNLLVKVEDLRESKRRQSQVHSKEQRSVNKVADVKMKKTQSFDEAIQAQQVARNKKISQK